VVLCLFNTKEFGHLVVQKTFAIAVGLNPFAVNDKLGDGALAGAGHYLVGGAGRVFNIDFCESDIVLLQEALGGAAVRAPEGGIEQYRHVFKKHFLCVLCAVSLANFAVKAFNRKGRKEFRKERGESKAASISLTANS
jgi:hypothetical protein